jgi:hypothetical protein
MSAEYGPILKIYFRLSRIDDVKCAGTVETADNPTRQPNNGPCSHADTVLSLLLLPLLHSVYRYFILFFFVQ